MALLGVYVGVIPIALGMLWLPFVRRIGAGWLRVLMAVTVGLLAFLAVDATLEGLELAGEGSQAFGGAALVFARRGVAYLALTGVDAGCERGAREGAAGAGRHLALLVAVGIGLHNLGEGLAIGSAYAVGALALGAFLVVGFAMHNTTEGLAIVAPIATDAPVARAAGAARADRRRAGDPRRVDRRRRVQPERSRRSCSASAPARSSQVIVQLAPTLRDGAGRLLHPARRRRPAGRRWRSCYATGLLVSV